MDDKERNVIDITEQLRQNKESFKIEGQNALRLFPEEDETFIQGTSPISIDSFSDNEYNESLLQEAVDNDAMKSLLEDTQEVSELEKGQPQQVEGEKQDNKEEQEEDSGTKKALKAVGRGAAAYFTGGSSIGKDKMVTENKAFDRLVGVVSNTVDKVPGVKQVTNELDEAGVTDLANDIMDTVGSAKEGDLREALEKGKDTKKSSNKLIKYVTKKVLGIILVAFTILFFMFMVLFIIVSPVVGGFLEATDTTEAFDGDDDTPELIYGEDFEDAVGDVSENYGNLSDTRQRIIAAATSALGRPYDYGGHPNGPGLDGIPSKGLDCGGYVQWALWTALGSSPGTLTTASISDLIGTKFIEISESELQPGDIGLKYRGYNSKVQNHTGIYAGDGKWMHAKGAKWGIVAGNYSGFTVFLRYVDVQ